MSPIDHCAVAFATRGVDFAHILELHYQHGFVFSTPDYFVMGRPVIRSWSAELIRDPFCTVSPGDAWWIHGYWGDLLAAFKALPYELPFIGWEKFDLDCRFYPIDAVRRLGIPKE